MSSEKGRKMRFRYVDESNAGAHTARNARVFVDDQDVTWRTYAVDFHAGVDAPARAVLYQWTHAEFIDTEAGVTVRHAECSHCTGHSYEIPADLPDGGQVDVVAIEFGEEEEGTDG